LDRLHALCVICVPPLLNLLALSRRLQTHMQARHRRDRSRHERRPRGLSAGGMNDYVAKPINKAELLEKIAY
jgi:DNA-binding response OmpR family regulator